MSKKIVEVNEAVIATNTHVVIPPNRHWTIHDGIVIEPGATLDLTQPGARLVIVKHPPPPAIDLISGNTVLNGAHDTVLCDTAGGAFTVTLPPLGRFPSKRYEIKNIGVAGNDVTVDGDGAETIDLSPTFALIDGEALALKPHVATGWWAG